MTAVVFDLDGVLLDSEQTWDDARRAYVAAHGGTWRDDATRAMMGMSSNEWSRYLHDELAVPDAPEAISADVAARVLAVYERELPLLPHAAEAVRGLAERWPLGLASSSNRSVIEVFLDRSGLRPCFTAVVSAEEVAHGKPAPDVYLAVADALGVPAPTCVAVEDSTNGILAAKAARAHVVAVPNRRWRPDGDVLAQTEVVLESLAELTTELVATIAST